jgi:hypothetical protein
MLYTALSTYIAIYILTLLTLLIIQSCVDVYSCRHRPCCIQIDTLIVDVDRTTLWYFSTLPWCVRNLDHHCVLRKISFSLNELSMNTLSLMNLINILNLHSPSQFLMRYSYGSALKVQLLKINIFRTHNEFNNKKQFTPHCIYCNCKKVVIKAQFLRRWHG